MVALQKFDVLKTNICPRGEASKANMLVLRTSNLANFEHSIVFTVHDKIIIFFCVLVRTFKINFLRWKPRKGNVKYEKENRQNHLNTISIIYVVQTHLFTE